MTDTTFRLPLTGGQMVYSHISDRWSLWSIQNGRLDDICANHFKTIREFKAWGQEKIDGQDRLESS